MLKQHLRKPRDHQGQHEPNELLTAMHRDVHRDIEAGHLAEGARITLQPLLQAFDDVLGKCERIRKTPIPFSYSSYVKQFVVLYAIMVPFALVKDFGYGAVIASMFSFFATMGLELLATLPSAKVVGDEGATWRRSQRSQRRREAKGQAVLNIRYESLMAEVIDMVLPKMHGQVSECSG